MYYKTPKGHYYKKNSKGDTFRISEKDYIKYTKRKGGVGNNVSVRSRVICWY